MQHGTNALSHFAHTIDIESADSCGELVAFLALEQELRHFLASALVERWNWKFVLALGSLDSGLLLVLVVNGAETIVGITFLVVGFGLLCTTFPDTFLLERKSSPTIA